MTALISGLSTSFSFGAFLLIPERQLLLENGTPVRLGGRACDLLTVLVQRHGEVVTKRELLARVWPGLIVEESNLKVNMAAIRRALGEDTGVPRYIATVVGRGYRFIAPVHATATHPFGAHAPRPLHSGRIAHGDKPIFGREDVIREVLNDLGRGRLVSIVGPGGAGKTTVALEASGRAAPVLEKTVRFVDLSVVDNPGQVPEAISDVLRPGNRGSGPSRVPGGADDPDMLLVLDNCEHLVGAVAQTVDRMLATTRNLKIIVTSREPLCIRGERVRRLHGLGLPPRAEGIKAADAMAYPALQMFVDRATRHCGAFRLDDGNAPAVTAICQRLDGLALAIERVAHRVGALGVAGMLEHLDRRFHMLDGYHEGPERHRTLTAAVETSHVLLSLGEQATMRRIAAFSGAFSLESACALCEAMDTDRATVIEAIAALVSKSLLTAEYRDGEMVYRQAHVIRAYALDKLAASGELEHVRSRAADPASRERPDAS